MQKMLLFGFIVFVVFSVISTMDYSGGSMTGNFVAVTDTLAPREPFLTYVPCPQVFSNQACVWNPGAIMRFRPLFQVWMVPGNHLLGARMSFGKPECVYQKKDGANIYRLQGELLQAGTCVAAEQGFLCR